MERIEESVRVHVCVHAHVCVCVCVLPQKMAGTRTPQPILIRSVLKLINYSVLGQNDLTRFQMS